MRRWEDEKRGRLRDEITETHRSLSVAEGEDEKMRLEVKCTNGPMCLKVHKMQ